MNTIKNIISKWRRGISGVLAFLLAFLLFVPETQLFPVFAETELEAENLPNNTSSSKTTFRYFGNGKIDFHGILNEEDRERSDPYYTQSGTPSPYVRTTYNDNGYQTYIKAYDASSTNTNGSVSLSALTTNGGIADLSSLGVELQMRAYPSSDDRLIILEYTIQNNKDTENHLQLGLNADTMVGAYGGAGSGNSADSAKLELNNERFYMSNSVGGTGWDQVSTSGGGKVPRYESFSLIFKDDSLGLTPPDYKWIGPYGSRNYYTFDTNPTHGSNAVYNSATQTYSWPAEGSNNRDSGLAIGWKIDLAAREKQTRKIAFNAQGPSYYVNWENGHNPEDGDTYRTWHGTADKPFKTIERALQAVGSNSGYIYIQNYKDIDSSIKRYSGSGVTKQTVTFEAADYDMNLNPLPNNHVTLKRAGELNGPMFTIDDGSASTFRFANLTLDGNNGSASIVKAGSGTIGIQSGMILQHADVTEDNTGAAVDISGTANLLLTGGTISNNISQANGGAVHFMGSGKFAVQGDIKITDNYGPDGSGDGKDKHNVYLASGKVIEVTDNLGESRIGITTQDDPVADTNGVFTDPGEEVNVASWKNTVKDSTLQTVTFISDGKLKNADGSAGDIETAYKTGDDKTVVFRRSGYKITFSYMNEDGARLYSSSINVPNVFIDGNSTPLTNNSTGTDLPSVGLTGNVSLMIGAPVSQMDASSDASGTPSYPYVFKEARIADSSIGWGFGADGSVSGTVTMPSKSFTINYIYEKKTVTTTFYKDAAGTGTTPIVKTGKAGENIYGVPAPSRNGYVFVGWSITPNAAAPNVFGHATADGEWVQDTKKYPNHDSSYYPVFKLNTGAEFRVSGEYANENGSVIFRELKAVQKHYQEEVKIGILNAHGYVLDEQSSYSEPSTVDAWSGNSVFNSGFYDAKMPADDLQVHLRYKLAPATDSNKQSFKVLYLDTTGHAIRPEAVVKYMPEDSISEVIPPEISGYELRHAYKFYGFERREVLDGSSPTVTEVVEDQDLAALLPSYSIPQLSADQLYSDSTGEFDSAHRFTGTMGNRETVIAYVYESDGTTAPFITKYMDSDTQDDALKVISETSSEPAFGSSIHYTYQKPYGYDYDSAADDPRGTGVFDPVSHDYTATMPLDELRAIYTMRRDNNWQMITYKSGEHGYLDRTDASPDLVDEGQAGSGIYQASILVSDGSQEGDNAAYQWNTIQDRKLCPTAVPDQYYRLKGWILDANDNGVQDSDEHFISDTENFSGPVTLTAIFEEDPDQWIDIHFVAGDHGTINDGQRTDLHITKDSLWSAVAKPLYTPEINYVFDGWYDADGVRMSSGTRIKPDQIYKVMFAQDPNAFGTEPSAPDASGNINNDTGKGKITVHDTTPGYKYTITDLNGKIIAVKSGDTTGIAVFDDLDPETRYNVYESTGTEDIVPGNDISTVNAAGPTEVLVPAVDQNYDVTFDDKNEGKTILSIKPADPDSDYALIDPDGNPVITDGTNDDGWKKPKKGEVVFDNLDYDKEYKVVARRHNDDSTVLEKEADASLVVTNPGEELELPVYRIETKRGEIESVNGESINADLCENAHSGETVTLTADETDFLYWQVTIGTIPGVSGKITDREFTFTMPDTNLVLTAYYRKPIASPSNITLRDETRGAGEREIALNPDRVSELEEELTTDADRVLMYRNGAKVLYKLIYKKNRVESSENDAAKAESPHSEHEDAYTGAFGLDVSVERYVNGRKVDSVASGSNIPYDGVAFDTYIQLDKSDTDNMDYVLYEVETDTSGNVTLTPVDMSDDPETTGGLFHFDAYAGKRYILVYSKAYRLYFIDNYADPKYKYGFKVRKGESPDSYPEYDNLEEPISGFTDPASGYEYTYEGWSRKENTYKKFDASDPIKKKVYIYAFYKDNRAEVIKARKDLEKELEDALRVSDDYFLKIKESEAVKEAIQTAAEVLNRENPRATIAELLDAVQNLKQSYQPYSDRLDIRYEDYGSKQSNGSHGGSNSGGGGKGSGSMPNPFVGEVEKSYYVGTNGNWKLVDGIHNLWAFVLNGGIRLTSRWAKLIYSSDTDTRNGWYHFNSKGYMDSGWFRDEKMKWYYCNTIHDGFFGLMQTGWHYDTDDKHWYYLDPKTGEMLSGWQLINGKWYYFAKEENTSAITYSFDDAIDRWVYLNTNTRPYGSMYVSEKTPDGFQVDGSGAWIG
jgi:glucan-binding YG repeat protein